MFRYSARLAKYSSRLVSRQLLRRLLSLGGEINLGNGNLSRYPASLWSGVVVKACVTYASDIFSSASTAFGVSQFSSTRGISAMSLIS